MGSLRHANAKTTARIREEIQYSKEKIAALAERYHVNFNTILILNNADNIEDGKNGPKEPRSTVLTKAEEQVICEFSMNILPSIYDLKRKRISSIKPTKLMASGIN